MAEAISCGARLVAALQQRPAEEVAAALAAAPAARAPVRKKGKPATDDPAQCTESCPIRCIGAWCISELAVPADILTSLHTARGTIMITLPSSADLHPCAA